MFRQRLCRAIHIPVSDLVVQKDYHFDGQAPDGEVEDYFVQLLNPDWPIREDIDGMRRKLSRTFDPHFTPGIPGFCIIPLIRGLLVFLNSTK